MLVPPVAAVLVLLGVHHGRWTANDVAVAIGVTTVICALSVGAGMLWQASSDRRRDEQPAPAPDRLSRDRLEEWRSWLRSAVLDTRVEQGGQLDQMLVHGEDFDPSAKIIDPADWRPAVGVGGQVLAWSKIVAQWDGSQGRMVILGEPGYGKTVAALTLIAHINSSDQSHASVAELFSLADWYHWRGERSAAPLGNWLAEQLAVTYQPNLPLEVARQLVAEGWVLPILDGLDEIPTLEQRRAAVKEIGSYARRAEPHRPFVVTCRAAEYSQLDPDLVPTDEHIQLAGLSPHQIMRILKARTDKRQGWHEIRREHAAGNEMLAELFRSPLHLGNALQAYHRDPGELLNLTLLDAESRLWDLLLSSTCHTFAGHSTQETRASLAFLATQLKRLGRQRFMLHELYVLDPDQADNVRRFKRVGGLVFGLVGGLVFGLVGALVFGLVSGLVGALVGSKLSPRPSVRVPADWLTILRRAITPENLVGGLLVGLVLVLVGVLVGVPVVGLRVGLVSGLVVGLVAPILDARTEVVATEAPTRFAHARPDAVLIASRNHGLVFGLAFTLGVGLVGGLALGLLVGLGGLVGGLALGLLVGLDAWLYHHWLRLRLHSRGELPRKLPDFLLWCADPSRSWIRITNAYEFRHRELLDYLSRQQPVQPSQRRRWVQ